jgi:hypothetical protein
MCRSFQCSPEALLLATRDVNWSPVARNRPELIGIAGDGDGWETIGDRPYVLAAGVAAVVDSCQ